MLSNCAIYACCTSYIGTGTNVDPRKCTPGTPGICHPNATCTQVTPHVCACNPTSSYRCECNQGYIGDGLNCTGELALDIALTNEKKTANMYIRKQLLSSGVTRVGVTRGGN